MATQIKIDELINRLNSGENVELSPDEARLFYASLRYALHSIPFARSGATPGWAETWPAFCDALSKTDCPIDVFMIPYS